MERLLDHDLYKHLFPEPDALQWQHVWAEELAYAALESTDQRIAEDKPVTPAFLLAAFFWPVVKLRAEQLRATGEGAVPALHSAAQQVISEASQHLSIPRRFSQPMREIWEFQLRLERRRGRKAAELVDHRRFRAAYDFLLLREQAGELDGDLGAWWTEFQTLPLEERLKQVAEQGGKARRPRKRQPASG